MIIDEYGLTPMQLGMLFHHATAEQTGVDIEQLVIGYKESPDISTLEKAWQVALEKHPVLRTSFQWEGLSEPVQRVHDGLRIRIEQRETCDESSFSAFIAADRERGFDLRQPPLMRLTFFGSGVGRSLLVWTLHHILMDGRSFIIVLNEVEQFYRDLRDSILPTGSPGLQFKPYVEWVRQVDLDGANDFWREKLKGFTAPTPLPYEPDLPPKGTPIHGEIEVGLPEEITSALRVMAQEEEVTLNTVVMGVWAIVLGRFCGEPEVVFGATKTTRRGSVANADSIVGLFLNTIPVRIAVRGATPVVEMLRQLRAEWVSLRRYEYTPLVQIKQASDFRNSAALFDSLVVYENQRFDTALATSELQWRERKFRWFEQTNLGLTLLAYGDRAMTLKLEFAADRFSRTTAQRLLAHVVQAFASVADNPNETIGNLTIIPEEERQRILIDWNRTELRYPGEVPLAALVEAQVAKTPEAVAVVFGEQSLSYRDLNEKSNQVARELVKHGAGPDELIGIFVERSLFMMIAVLAVAKSGAAYLPMETHLPAARLRHMIEDSGVQLVVTQRDLQSELPWFKGGIVTNDQHEWGANRSENLNIPVKPEHLAYVIYTSGSTGKPKGVQVSYRSLVNLLWSVRDWLKSSNTDRQLAVTTVSFDIAGVDIWLPWLVGSTTILASREAAADGTQLQTLIYRHDITFMQATPVTWWLLLGTGWRGKSDLQIVCTGEAMTRELAARLAPMVKRLWNMYGPTETTIWSTGYLVEGVRGPVLIGRPIGNTQCYILDERRKVVPIGSVGELYVSGDGLARGYLNRPELSEDKFVPNPFSQQPRARMYRTGDLARFLPDGNIESLGRTDHQIKIRGFRIEPGEIEASLKLHKGIRQAVVVAREDVPPEKRLVAYFVPSSTQVPDRTELRSFLKQQLPEYMVPVDWVMLESLPISSNGKIDRKALPAPTLGEDASSTSCAYKAPRNEMESTLVEIFSYVLGTQKVGINDDFFDLGGHSLTAMRVISLIKSKLNVELPVRILFQAQTVSQIAAFIADGDGKLAERPSEEWSTCIPIQPNGSKLPLFCVARPNVNALGYVFLSRRLGSDQPVYGLQRRMPEDQELDFTPEQIRETAKEYVRVMRSVQHRGPYLLVGQCQGAYIAFEMTRQLESQGERVCMLGMLDVWPEENTRYKVLFFAHSYMRKLLGLFTRKAANGAISNMGSLTNDNLAEAGPLAPAPPGGSGKRLWRMYWPEPGFKPEVISSNIVVFRVASQPIYRIRDRAMGWGNRTSGGVEVEEIPGDHITFLREPFVKVVAEKINRNVLGSLKESWRAESSIGQTMT